MMRSGLLWRRLQLAWACGFTLAMLLNLDQFLFAAGVGPAPKYWSCGVFLVTLALFFPGMRWGKLLHAPVVKWAVAYLLLSLLWIWPADNLESARDGLMMVITTCLYVGAAALAYPALASAGRLWRLTLWGALILGMMSIVAEYFYPSAFVFAEAGQGIAGRAAGLYLNPNISAQVMVLILACLMTLGKPWESLAAMAVALVGLFLTFSRAGLIAWLLLVVVGGLMKRLPRFVLPTMVIGTILIIAAGPFVFDTLSTIISPENRNSLNRLSWLLGQGGLNDYSAGEREWVVTYAWQQFLETPVLGHGLGYMWVWAAPQGAHNMLLRFMVEYGALGMLVFPSFILAAVLSSRERANRRWLGLCGLIAMFLGLFSHNMLEQASFVFPWLAMCLMPLARSSGFRGGSTLAPAPKR